jgi:DNA mismatch endonuclease (patch repair protein)
MVVIDSKSAPSAKSQQRNSRRKNRRRLPGGPIDPARSALMSRVKGKHSRPEVAVRRLAHRLGYRFRLHSKDLPAKPDVVFGGRRKVIFVHGCFWHRHPNCSRTTNPKTRARYWAAKFAANIRRDRRAVMELERRGWNVLVVWECETFDESKLAKTLVRFLH